LYTSDKLIFANWFFEIECKFTYIKLTK